MLTQIAMRWQKKSKTGTTLTATFGGCWGESSDVQLFLTRGTISQNAVCPAICVCVWGGGIYHHLAYD